MGINKLKVVLTEEAQAFLDTEEETLVIATHGIVKKTQKTPLKEITKAEEIRKEYFNNKKNSIMAQMKLIPADNMKDKLWGKRGTPEREAMETKLKEDVNAYIVGEAIRKARLAQNLTQEQLGERIGVQRAQISKLEKGTSVITLPTMSRVFQALGIATATLDLGIAGKIALW